MRKLIILLFILSSFSFMPIPNSIKAEDIIEWGKYVEYCNTWVSIDLVQYQKYRLKIDTTIGHYVLDNTYRNFWYKFKIPTYAEPQYKSYSQDPPSTSGDYRVMGIKHQYFLKRRRATVTDFYNYWITDSIPH